MSNLVKIEPEYIYVMIPAEYICVYHRILAMLADYGEDMLKDCKASCTDKNSGVIECFNMFNAAVAARKLGKDKLAETLIKYIKAKINQIYRGHDNSTSFVFPVDAEGEIKAFVSCGELPTFEVSEEDGELYKQKMIDGVNEGFNLDDDEEEPENPLSIDLELSIVNNSLSVNYNIYYKYDEEEESTPVEESDEGLTLYKYFGSKLVDNFNNITVTKVGVYNVTIVAVYNNHTCLISKDINYAN